MIEVRLFLKLDEETRRIVMEKDLGRLKQMTFYCATSSCLRHYILDYFGETPPSFWDKNGKRIVDIFILTVLTICIILFIQYIT